MRLVRRPDSGVCSGICQTTGAEAADSHSHGAPVEGPAAADAIQGEDADERGQHVGDVVQAADPLAIGGADACQGEDGWAVDGDARDANLVRLLAVLDDIPTESEASLPIPAKSAAK